MALNRAKVSQDITVNADMSYAVTIQFFDSADAPGTVLWEETITVPSGATTAQLQAVVLARGQQIRAGLANQAAARVAVPNGTTVTVP